MTISYSPPMTPAANRALATALPLGSVDAFYDDPAGRVLVAMLANQLAKEFEVLGDTASRDGLYQFKRELLAQALRPGNGLTFWGTPHQHGDYGQFVIFFEEIPGVGQLSFHVSIDDSLLAPVFAIVPKPDGRTWNGVPKQPYIRQYLVLFLRAKGYAL